MQRQESELSYICVRSIDFAFFLQFCNWILELCRQCVFFVFLFMVYTPFYRVFHVVSIDMSLTVTIYLVCFQLFIALRKFKAHFCYAFRVNKNKYIVKISIHLKQYVFVIYCVCR